MICIDFFENTLLWNCPCLIVEVAFVAAVVWIGTWDLNSYQIESLVVAVAVATVAVQYYSAWGVVAVEGPAGSSVA